MNKLTIELIKSALWSEPIPNEEITPEVYKELREHTIHVLVYDVVEKAIMRDKLQNRWVRDFANQVNSFSIYMNTQKEIHDLLLGEGIIPVVLKGLMAAKYYPEPAYRCLGDIDIFPFSQEQNTVQKVVTLLKENGYEVGEDDGRHIECKKNEMILEIHYFFSTKKTAGDIELDKILNDSTPVESVIEKWPESVFYTFKDEVNGLIFLQHINQHLISGLGF